MDLWFHPGAMAASLFAIVVVLRIWRFAMNR
jgi:hypothetical protein